MLRDEKKRRNEGLKNRRQERSVSSNHLGNLSTYNSFPIFAMAFVAQGHLFVVTSKWQREKERMRHNHTVGETEKEKGLKHRKDVGQGYTHAQTCTYSISTLHYI